MQVGAIIERGPMDWQIFQQVNGKADISLSGYFISGDQPDGLKVYVRIVKEETGDSVIPWQMAESPEKGRWSITVKNVPAGGLYRIETCLNHESNLAIEWATRGDMVHHIGVGDVYVITGQSNAAGYGKDPAYDPPELGIHLLRNSGKWDLASHPLNESTNTIHEENREGANPGNSPYLSFARQLKRELGYPIGLIQSSLGGSPISAWNPEEDGILYRSMMKTLNSQEGRVKGILWYQGCSDTGEGTCDTYLERFKVMVSHMRKDLKDENLPVLTVQLSRHVSPADKEADRRWGKVREAQRQAARQIPNVYVIPSLDSSLSDAIHISSSSNVVLGERLAKTALKNIYGRDIIFSAPDIIEARKVQDDKILLVFENVQNRLYPYEVGAGELPFAVEDEKGFAKIKGYEQKDAETITLSLERKLEGECQVHGAYEENPRYILPVDFASHLPMLSFYGVKVSE